MSFVNKISGILKHDNTMNIEADSVQKVLLLNFTLIVTSFFSFIFSLLHIFFLDKSIGFVLLSFFLSLFSMYFLFKKFKNYELFSALSLIIITALFIIISLKGAGEKTGIIWGLSYPIFISFTNNRKKANLFSFLFLLFNILIFYVPSDYLPDYPFDLKLRFIALYLLIYFLLRYYITLKQQAANNKEKQIIEAKQQLRLKDEFLSKLSYQIRTPLNNIAGIINLKRELLDNEIVEETELSISNLISIINTIQDAFDQKGFKIEGEKTNFGINATLKKSVTLFQTEQYKDLKLSLNLSGKVPKSIFGDRLLFLQLVISNIDFLYKNKTEPSLKIEITSELVTKNEKNFISLKLTNNNSFQKFINETEQELNSADFKNKDLLMIKELSEALSANMNINFQSNYLIFEFEVKNEKSGEKNKIYKEDQDNFFYTKVKKELKDVTVLLVEDDVMNSKVMTLNLEKYVKNIIIAVNGKEALEKYASTRVDIILMDIRMPLMDGFKTTEKIRESEQGTGYQTPIIAVTANASSDIKNRCFEVGMNDYTTKPTNFKLLIKKIEAQLK